MEILLVSASQVARITGVSHWCLADIKIKLDSLSIDWPGMKPGTKP
jgi:hypothetical protein